jgi:uncharacterized membrane protein YhaH (DUF805 family)
MNYYLSALKKYAQFSGRARRKEYWMFAFVNIIIFVILGILGYFVNGQIGGIIGGIYGLLVLIPSLAVLVRRLHDIGKSGWWILIGLVPFIGEIVLLIFSVMDGQPGQNQYGSNPKEVAGV